MGAGLGFVMGIVVLILSLLQFDDEISNSKDVALSIIFVIMPFMVLIGLGAGAIWSRFFGANSL
jgi:hypothetical protein